MLSGIAWYAAGAFAGALAATARHRVLYQDGVLERRYQRAHADWLAARAACPYCTKYHMCSGHSGARPSPPRDYDAWYVLACAALWAVALPAILATLVGETLGVWLADRRQTAAVARAERERELRALDAERAEILKQLDREL